MASKSKIMQQAMKNAIRIWELKSSDQLDPVIKKLVELFCQMNYENENSIEDIRERLLHQIAAALTPDGLVAAKPSHSIMKVTPMEPVTHIGRRDIFYTDKLTNAGIAQGLKTVNFTPAVDNIPLVRGEIQYLLCERSLYRLGMDGEKDLLTKTSVFNQDLNHCLYIGLSLDKYVESLKDIHFYFDFQTLAEKHSLFDLLAHTCWSIQGRSLTMETGIGNRELSGTGQLPGGIFSHYNKLAINDEEVMDLYHKQFLHVTDNIRTASLEECPFPAELLPFFPQRVKDLEEPLYWIKVLFPPYFKTEDLDDLVVTMNAFPVSNKNLNQSMLDRNKSLTGILTLPVETGEFFLAVDSVEDSSGKQYDFLPFSQSGSNQPVGTYTLKRGGLERFSTRDLADTVERMIDLYRSELVTYKVLKLDNIRNSISEMERTTVSIKERLDSNNSRLIEVPTYLLVEPEENGNYIHASYWTTNCELGNGYSYGTRFNPMHSIPLEKDSCRLLKASKGGKSIPKSSDMLTAYRYAMTTRDQLYTIRDIENYCRVKFSGRIQRVKVLRGIACSNKQKEGLIRVLDVCLTPSPEYQNYLNDPATQGELKTALEKRSPSIYNYRIIVEN